MPRDSFSVNLDVVIRPGREDDLPALEWFGMFARQRRLIRRVFAEHERGESLLLVAEVNTEASGQLWASVHRRRGGGVGEIWAVRVMPCLQRRGIGERLVRTGEEWLRARGCARAEVNVELDNPGGLRFWLRLGYRLAGTRRAGAADGHADRRMQWILGKELRARAPQPRREPARRETTLRA